MPIYKLRDEVVFPDPRDADASGVLAIGGDLSLERLLLAYHMGIFPWYSEGMPILWHSPDPRMVLPVDEIHVGRSLRKTMRKKPYALTMDTSFREVITQCSHVPRPGQDGTWILGEMIDAYCELHRIGFAHSVEAWQDGQLVGGLYGVSIGGGFFGESMFTRAPDASKICFVSMVEQLRKWDISLVDCQVFTEHLARFGAREIPRREFLQQLEGLIAQPTKQGKWSFDRRFSPQD